MSPELGSKILIVEDDPGISVLQRRRLERAGFRVAVAASVDEALAALAGGAVALVVLDYRLGETTGLDLHRRMKAAGIEAPVILVSGAMEDAAVVEAMRAGIRDIVVKTPDYLEYLPDAVRVVLNQASRTDSELTPARAGCVLIVEDDPGTAILERKRLERAGYTVRDAASAEEALTTIRGGDVALAVIDLRLNDGSGLELYERMKADGYAIPAILVTAFADQAVAIRALRAGISDFIPKSNDFLEYLPAAVDRVITQSRVERKLVESELRLASIIGTTLDAILMCDERFRVLLFNRSAEQMFDCRAADALTRPVADFIPELELGLEPRGEAVRERRELDALRCDGATVPIEVSVSDVVIHGRRLYTVIARDISERRQAEAELREADRRKDEFLGMLAHELRNPLAAIMNAGEVLHRTLGSSPSIKLTTVIRRQTRALSRMVDDLLDVSRVTLGKIQLTPEPILLGEVTSRAAEATREAATAAGLALKVDVDSDVPLWIDGDATRLEQVITNLLTNAVKFTPAGGTIAVTAAAEAGHAVVRVRDTGIGIAPALLPRVFDLFVQGDTSLDRSRSGLGIGLALVRQIVALHGGTVTAASAGIGRGAEFVVRVPLAEQDVRPFAEAPRASRVGERAMRVLVVDDQPDIADSVALLIEALGHRAQAVYDGASALALSRETPPDAIFVDIGMPGMTGYELAQRVRRDPALAHLTLIALTGYGREDDRRRVVEAGFDHHVTKPVTDADLHAILSSMATTR